MSVQYTDGTFGETMPVDEAVEAMRDAIEAGTARALHVGTEEQIEQIKKSVPMEDKLKQMEQTLKELQADKNGVIDTSTCLHDTCTKCNGTGVDKLFNYPCVHFISCPCPKCTPMF